MSSVPWQPAENNQEARPPTQSIPLTPEEWRMVEDLDWAHDAPEVQQHEGKLVLIRNKRVVAVGTDEAAMRKQAAEQEHCSEWDFVVELVPSSDYLLNPD